MLPSFYLIKSHFPIVLGFPFKSIRRAGSFFPQVICYFFSSNKVTIKKVNGYFCLNKEKLKHIRSMIYWNFIGKISNRCYSPLHSKLSEIFLKNRFPRKLPQRKTNVKLLCYVRRNSIISFNPSLYKSKH